MGKTDLDDEGEKPKWERWPQWKRNRKILRFAAGCLGRNAQCSSKEWVAFVVCHASDGLAEMPDQKKLDGRLVDPHLVTDVQPGSILILHPNVHRAKPCWGVVAWTLRTRIGWFTCCDLPGNATIVVASADFDGSKPFTVSAAR